MNKKGFSLIETLIVVVILTTSLLVIYSSYSSTILREKERLYYDDINKIYETIYVRDYLFNDTNLKEIIDDVLTSDVALKNLVTINDLIYNENDLNKYKEAFHIYNIFLVNKNFKFSECTDKVLKSDYSCSSENSVCKVCKNTFQSSSLKLRSYLKTLNNLENNYLVFDIYEKKDGSAACTTSNYNSSVNDNKNVCVHYYVYYEVK